MTRLEGRRSARNCRSEVRRAGAGGERLLRMGANRSAADSTRRRVATRRGIRGTPSPTRLDRPRDESAWQR